MLLLRLCHSKSVRRLAFVLVMGIVFSACVTKRVPQTRLPLPEQELNAWHFDGEGWQKNPATAPRVLSRAKFVPSYSGFALRMSGSRRALVSFAATNKAGTPNLLDSGTVRFWFSPNWSSSSLGGTGPGQRAVLFETGAWESDSSVVHCSLQIDADGNTIRFMVQGPGGLETILSWPVTWNQNTWHQVALVRTATGTVLYLDGSPVTNGRGGPWLPAPVGRRVNGFCIGSDTTRRALAQGDFEELYTFARALTAGQVAADYSRNSSAAAVGPVYPAARTSRPLLSPAPASALAGTNMAASLYGCTLWLEVNRSTNNKKIVWVTLHNTAPGRQYRLWSKQDTQAWQLEASLVGPASQNFVTTNIAMKGRSNLFFVATALGNFVTNKTFFALQATNTGAGNPDAMGAVGPEHYFTIANALQGTAGVAVYDKCSGAMVQSLVSTQFFAVQHQGSNVLFQTLVDARVAYDSLAQRWVALALAQNPQKAVILAVSKSSSPIDLATNWTKYYIPFPANTPFNVNPDYPTLGLDQNGIYLSVMEQSFPGGVTTTTSNVVVAIKKPEIYQGTNILTRLMVTTNDLPAIIIQPAVNFDSPPRGQFAWFVAKQSPRIETNYLGGPISYRRLQWSGTNAVWADTNWVTLTNRFYRNYFDLDGGNVGAPHTNLGALYFPINLKNVGSRLMMAVIRDGALWTCHHVGLNGTSGTYTGNATGTNVDRSAVQWLKLSTQTNGSFLSFTNGRVYDASATNPFWYYFPSLTVNKAGDMVTGFSASRSNSFIGARYSYRAVNGTTPSGALMLSPGHGAFLGSSRWGDYSYTTVDPVDNLTMWTVQQYADDEFVHPGNLWGTIVGEILPNVTAP